MAKRVITVVILLVTLLPSLYQDILSNAQGILGTAVFKKRITGADLDTASKWRVAGTDLGIPYVLENGAIGFLFGDTFSTAWPEEGQGWRSPVMLRSHNPPGDGIIWDNAARVAGDGFAPGLFNKEDGDVTSIPNDGISFPETGRQLVSFMGIEKWYNGPNLGERGAMWKSRYAGLAYTDNGNDFTRTDLKWPNNADNSDPYQMWTMQRDGDWVYIFSVRSGRQLGPMMLRRVNWQRLFWPNEYECWGQQTGSTWGWGHTCTGLFEGVIGEPSVRKLSDGTWVMAYLNVLIGSVVTRKSTSPTGPWSGEKIQVTVLQESSQYGGFIHPWSTSGANGLHLMVSTWKHDNNGKSTAYHVSQWQGSV